jgi:hypothetical protein
MKIKQLIFFISFFSIVGWGPFSFIFKEHNKQPFGTREWIEDEIRIIHTQADNIDPGILKLALKAFIKARQQGLDHKQLLTVIDYSKPSTARRLWVIDIKNDAVIYNTWVTHGRNSGKNFATSFSNRPGSLQSSIGVFVTTSDPYVGGNGYSLRLVGLEPGINDNAFKRDIVIHGAWYANADVAKKYGQLGRSWGCPAVSDRLAKPLIDTIKERTIVFAYADNRSWIRNSPYLNG